VPRIDDEILAALGAHPHHTTPLRIAEVLPGPKRDPRAIDAALERLRAQGLVHTAAGHWQLTVAGYRTQRAA
jgi:hypothetical protein